MSTRTPDYQEAIQHLPEGATLVFQDFTWDEYERLLDDLGDRPGLRVSYDEGRLEIMSPLPEHEDHTRFIDDLVRALCDRFGLTLEKRGSTTWKERRLARGLEPDACYYVANAKHIIGKRTIDLASDPPPDIAVEIDVTNESLSKFVTYAALGVPEVWRYDGKTAHFYELVAGGYQEILESRCCPHLSATMVAEALEQSKKEGQTAALAAFRRQLLDLP